MAACGHANVLEESDRGRIAPPRCRSSNTS